MERKRYLEIGQITSPHGVRGEVRVQPWCDSPDFLTEFDRLSFNGGAVPVRVERARVHKGMAILKLDCASSMEEANALRGRVLWCDRQEVELDDRTFFIQDLIGLRVVDADEPSLFYGTLTQVSATGANDVYHIEKDGKTRLIPAIRQVVISTDPDAGEMRIRPLKGLFDDAD